MTCMDCGATLRATRAPYRYTDSGLPGVVLLGVEVRRCLECGAEEVAIPRIEELHRLMAQAVIRRPHRLTPAKIKYLRKCYTEPGFQAPSGAAFSLAPPDPRLRAVGNGTARWASSANAGPLTDRSARVTQAAFECRLRSNGHPRGIMAAEADRRYRQSGYRESAGERQEKREAPRPPDTAGSRTPRMPGSRTASRCAECGTLLPALPDPLGHCPKCGLALHSCKQCAHFDPGRRFECTQPIPEHIPDKSARNDCTSFSLRVMVERDSSPGSIRPEDARRAFGNLFKK